METWVGFEKRTMKIKWGWVETKSMGEKRERQSATDG